MKPTFRILPLCVLTLAACGGEDEKFPPGATTLVLDAQAQTISWDSIAGADSYNLYIKTVESCPDISVAEFQNPTKDDAKVENVTSPWSTVPYEGCTTCFYAAMAAVNGAGEGELSKAVGWQTRPQPCP